MFDVDNTETLVDHQITYLRLYFYFSFAQTHTKQGLHVLCCVRQKRSAAQGAAHAQTSYTSVAEFGLVGVY